MSGKACLYFVYLFATITVVFSHDDSSYLSYGNNCGSNAAGHPALCDFEALLECNSQGICRCIEPKIMTYNGSTCAVLAGESCLPTPNVWLLDNVTIFQQEDYLFPCVEHSTCNLRTHICQCFPGYYLGVDRKCHVKMHESSCRKEEDCGGKSTLLICNRRKVCGCNDDLTILFGEEQRCRGIVGASCDDFGKLCVPNAECSGETWSTRECRCKPGFSKSPDGRCLVTYSQFCSKEPGQNCNEKEEGTICLEGVCQCKSNQIWDDSRKRCKQQVESRCVDSLDCGEGMFCSEGGSEHDKRCKCGEGLIQADFNCHPPYGYPCDYKPGFHEEFDKRPYDNRTSNWICDPMVSGLRCVDGICQCKPTEYYDKVKKMCRGLVGTVCNYGLDAGGSYCTDNADCELYSGPDRFMGGDSTCQCDDGFSRNEHDHCV